jgi:hypothetical protein
LSYEIKDKWEVPRESVELTKVLGNGQYGEVYKGNSLSLLMPRD